MKIFIRMFGFALMLAAFSGVAHADTPVPEIDAGTAGSALTLLAGGMFIIRDRLRTR
jgi:hypothetical protein